MIGLVPVAGYQRELRLLCTRSARRILGCLPVASLAAAKLALDVGDRFAEGKAALDELRSVSDAMAAVAERLAPNRDVPEVADYALSAIVDATSLWPRNHSNVSATVSCASQAAGHAAAVAAGDDDHYDDVLYPVQAAEDAAQADLLRDLIPHLPEVTAK